MALRPKSTFRLIRDNTRTTVNFYNRKGRRFHFRSGGLVAKHARFQVRRGASGYPKRRTGAYDSNIRFAWDPGTNSTIAGPTRLKHFNVPRGLEYGGTTRWLIRGKFVRGTFVRGAPQSGLQKVQPHRTMARTLGSSYVRRQMEIIAREEYGA